MPEEFEKRRYFERGDPRYIRPVLWLDSRFDLSDENRMFRRFLLADPVYALRLLLGGTE